MPARSKKPGAGQPSLSHPRHVRVGYCYLSPGVRAADPGPIDIYMPPFTVRSSR
jgi:hypothetical protein